MIHVASPFPLDSPVDEMEVIRPAVEGTTNVLEACANTKGGVKRVVLTSSCAAVYGRTLLSNTVGLLQLAITWYKIPHAGG